MRYSDLKHGQLLITDNTVWISILSNNNHYLPNLTLTNAALFKATDSKIDTSQRVITPTIQEIVRIARSKCK